MKRLNTAATVLTTLMLCGCLQKVEAQILQSFPELCGSRNSVQVPSDFSITIAPGEGIAVLTSTLNLHAPVQLPGVQDEIAEVCRIGDDKLLIFGAAAGAYNVVVFDRSNAAVEDSFYAYDPKVSPDQHWLVGRSFYPPQSDVTFSEEYVLYDLTKFSNKQTIRLAKPPSNIERVIYPIVNGGRHFERTDLPPEHTHSFCSKTFYWSPDSRYVLFGDCVKQSLSLVLVDVRSQVTRVHGLEPSIDCGEIIRKGDASDTPEITVKDISFEQNDNVTVQLTSAVPSCFPKEVMLDFKDFLPPANEVHKPRQKKPAVLNQQ